MGLQDHDHRSPLQARRLHARCVWSAFQLGDDHLHLECSGDVASDRRGFLHACLSIRPLLLSLCWSKASIWLACCVYLKLSPDTAKNFFLGDFEARQRHSSRLRNHLGSTPSSTGAMPLNPGLASIPLFVPSTGLSCSPCLYFMIEESQVKQPMRKKATPKDGEEVEDDVLQRDRGHLYL